MWGWCLQLLIGLETSDIQSGSTNYKPMHESMTLPMQKWRITINDRKNILYKFLNMILKTSSNIL